MFAARVARTYTHTRTCITGAPARTSTQHLGTGTTHVFVHGARLTDSKTKTGCGRGLCVAGHSNKTALRAISLMSDLRAMAQGLSTTFVAHSTPHSAFRHLTQLPACCFLPPVTQAPVASPPTVRAPPPPPGDAHRHVLPFRPTITFLLSRHRNKVDRFIDRRGIIGLPQRGLLTRNSRSERLFPLADFGLASWPKSQLVKTSKIQKPHKLLKSLWNQEQEKSFCWEGPVWSCRFSS